MGTRSTLQGESLTGKIMFVVTIGGSGGGRKVRAPPGQNFPIFIQFSEEKNWSNSKLGILDPSVVTELF